MMNKLYYGSVRANGIKIQYYRTGEDKQPVVMLHGLTDSGLCWNYLAMALEPEYDVVLLDARGHGMSEKPAQVFQVHALPVVFRDGESLGEHGTRGLLILKKGLGRLKVVP